MNFPLQFCVPVVHKISCDLRCSLCPYESITILYTSGTQNLMRLTLCPYQSITILCTTGTQDLMRLYTFSSCRIRFLSTSVLIHQSHALNVPARLTSKKNCKSNPLVMKPVGPYRNIKHVALFSQADTK